MVVGSKLKTMGQSKRVFFTMTEEKYSEIPNEFKEIYLNNHNVTREINDFEENMKDDMFAKLYTQKKEVSKQLEERQYQLREERRRIKNIEVNE